MKYIMIGIKFSNVIQIDKDNASNMYFVYTNYNIMVYCI